VFARAGKTDPPSRFHPLTTSAGKMYGRLALNDHAACLLLASNARP
jgi:hypothetical protein